MIYNSIHTCIGTEVLNDIFFSLCRTTTGMKFAWFLMYCSEDERHIFTTKEANL